MKPIPSEVRRDVIKRDNSRCFYCPLKVDHVHHIWGRRTTIPSDLGDYTKVEDNNYRENLISLCSKHHGLAENGKLLSSDEDCKSLFRRNQILERIRVASIRR